MLLWPMARSGMMFCGLLFKLPGFAFSDHCHFAAVPAFPMLPSFPAAYDISHLIISFFDNICTLQMSVPPLLCAFNNNPAPQVTTMSDFISKEPTKMKTRLQKLVLVHQIYRNSLRRGYQGLTGSMCRLANSFSPLQRLKHFR